MSSTRHKNIREPWSCYVDRYRNGEWRAPIFHDMILDDARRLLETRSTEGGLTFLDIGCGSGFDDDPKLQQSLADECERYIGIEPDREIEIGSHIHKVHRSTFEEAPIEPATIDIAFSVMVMEHIADPEIFWGKISEVLVDGGIYWGLTVDARHFFRVISKLSENAGFKDKYLTSVHGDRGTDRYENYPTYYRTNSPRQIKKFTGDFNRVDYVSFSRVGQLDFYFPRWFHPIAHLVDWLNMVARLPGPVLAIRVEK